MAVTFGISPSNQINVFVDIEDEAIISNVVNLTFYVFSNCVDKQEMQNFVLNGDVIALP